MLTKSQLDAALNQPLARPDLSGAWLILCEDAGFLSALSLCKAEHARLKLGVLGSFSEWPKDLALLPARFMVNPVPGHAIGALSLLEDWGIANRWACEAFKPGTVEGSLEDLAKDYLATQGHEWDGVLLLTKPYSPLIARLKEAKLPCQMLS